MASDKLKIIILTAKNPFDNSGVLVYDWYNSLKGEGHSVSILTQYYDARQGTEINSIYGKAESYVRKKIHNIEHRFGEKKKTDSTYCMHSLNEIKNYIPTKKIIDFFPFQPDLIVYLFPHGFLNARNLYELNQYANAPICVAPVDMAEFTGGCHYTNGCIRFEKACGNCPGLFSSSKRDKTNQNILYKIKYISQTNLFTVSNTWTSTFLRRSSVFANKRDFQLNVVVNELDYSPGNKDDAKNYFGISSSKNVIFFGANYIQEKRKGFVFFVQAMNLLYRELDESERSEIVIAVAGSHASEIIDSLPFDVYHLGQLTHDTLNKAFQMSDVFVSPSIQDAGPMMVIQAMMCGTPVVSFEMGNSIDYIVDGKTGYQCTLYDSCGLKDGIKKLIHMDSNEKKKISMQCRNLAVSKSSYKVFAESFTTFAKNFIPNG